MCAFVDNISAWLACDVSALSQIWNTSKLMEHSLPLAWLNKKRKIDEGLKVAPPYSLTAESVCNRKPTFLLRALRGLSGGLLKCWRLTVAAVSLAISSSFFVCRREFLKQEGCDNAEYHPEFHFRWKHAMLAALWSCI